VAVEPPIAVVPPVADKPPVLRSGTLPDAALPPAALSEPPTPVVPPAPSVEPPSSPSPLGRGSSESVGSVGVLVLVPPISLVSLAGPESSLPELPEHPHARATASQLAHITGFVLIVPPIV
jgi:hypothetical protein